MALVAGITWRVRSAGSDDNGGGFEVAAAGTDRSQQDAAQVAIDNVTITTSITTTVITFTAGYTPTSADVGNIVQMLTGTNVTAGFYRITAQDSTTWTVDRNVVTSGTTTDATGNMGGGLATPGKAGGAHVAGNTVSISSGDYTCSGTSNVAGGRFTVATGAGNDDPVTIIGVGTKPRLLATANGMDIVFITSGLVAVVENLEFGKNASETTVTGIDAQGANSLIKDCKFTSIGNGMDLASSNITVLGCLASGCTTGFNAASAGRLVGCVADGCTTGFALSQAMAIDCLSIGTAGIGFSITDSRAFLNRCTSWGSTGANGDGFRVSAGAYPELINCLSYNNAQLGFNDANSTVSPKLMLLNCAGGGNTAGNHDFQASAVSGFITLTADPFTNAAGDDFSLNDTAGGGADLKGAGYPSSFQGLASSTFPDVGAVQTESGGGAATLMVIGPRRGGTVMKM